jgi:hypothetical protein
MASRQLSDFFCVANHAAPNSGDLLANRRHDNRGTAAFNQLDPEPILETAQLCTQSGLADAASLSGASKMTFFLEC